MAIQDRDRERFVQALRSELGADGLSLDGVLAIAARMRKDAERYQWLRKASVTVQYTRPMPFPACHIQGLPVSCTTSWWATGEELDSRVDAEISAAPVFGAA